MKQMYKYNDPFFEGRYSPELSSYPIIGETEKGYYLHLWNGKRWCPKESKNGFAFDTKKKAMYNYIKRKEYQIGIYEWRLEFAKGMLKQAQVEYETNRD